MFRDFFATSASLNLGSSTPMVKLLTFLLLNDCINATTVVLSIPEERKAPTGTSATI